MSHMTEKERKEMLEALHQALEAKFEEVKSEVRLKRPLGIVGPDSSVHLQHDCTPKCSPNCPDRMTPALFDRCCGDAA